MLPTYVNPLILSLAEAANSLVCLPQLNHLTVLYLAAYFDSSTSNELRLYLLVLPNVAIVCCGLKNFGRRNCSASAKTTTFAKFHEFLCKPYSFGTFCIGNPSILRAFSDCFPSSFFITFLNVRPLLIQITRCLLYRRNLVEHIITLSICTVFLIVSVNYSTLISCELCFTLREAGILFGPRCVLSQFEVTLNGNNFQR